MTVMVPRDTDWAALSFADRKRAVAERWAAFQRGVRDEAWDIGRGLRAVKNEMQHGEWLPWIREIGMERTAGHRFMALADGYQTAEMLQSATSVESALKALPPKRPKEEPAAGSCSGPSNERTKHELPTKPVTGEVLTEAEGKAAMEDAAAEAEAETAEAEREAREERLAHRLESAPGKAVDALSGQLDKADARHRDDVGAVKDARKAATTAWRKTRDVCDALLAAKPCECGSGAIHAADTLARFYGVARK